MSDQDAELLAAFAPIAEPHIRRITRDFYQHAGVPDGVPIEALRPSLEDWMIRALSGSPGGDLQPLGPGGFRSYAPAGLPRTLTVAWLALIHVELARVADWLLGRSSAKMREVLERQLDRHLALVLGAYAAPREPITLLEANDAVRRRGLHLCV